MEKLSENIKGVDISVEEISIDKMVEDGEAKVIIRDMTDEEINNFQKSIADWEETK